jgi:hypothetical protein
MAWYRFTEPARQSNYVQFGLAIGVVCDHLVSWSIGINSISVRGNKLAFDTTAAIAADQLPHLGLEAG